ETISVPKSIVVTPANKSAVFSWIAPTDDTKYINIYEKKNESIFDKKIQVAVDETGAVVTGLENGKEYTFAVTGASDTKETDKTMNEFKVIPKETVSSPINIVAVAGDGSVTISWEHYNDDTQYINIYLKKENGELELKAKKNADDTGITISNLENDKLYTFVITGASDNIETDKGENVINVMPRSVDPLVYEPSDITISSRGSIEKGFRLAWKNPVCEGLKKVVLYSINEDGKKSVISNPIPGAITYADVLANKDYGQYSFKFNFEFSDGITKELYYSLRAVHDNAAVISSKAGIQYYHKNGSGAKTKVAVYVVDEENATEEGKQSLKIISNRQSISEDAEENGNKYLLRFNESMYPAMENGVEYKLTMKVKSSKDAAIELCAGDNSTYVKDIIVPASNKWETVEEVFTGKYAQKSGGLVFAIVGLKAPLYIDDVKLVRVSDDFVMVDQAFETVAISVTAPSSVKAKAGVNSAELSWITPSGSDTRFINIYEKLKDGTLILRAKTLSTDNGIVLSNLVGGKKYEFVLTGSGLIGLETDRMVTPVTVTPQMSEF
ncbi:MAG: hypothetical protein IJQ28_02080, partial [Clostridia bacterium]|nr:hypothetical protein [Clostridia bacterium]